ncbi:Conserved_hypothetical protein [Hexamita inflata]|uniref:Zinc finger PHD-type domain-containing protein n=1 Tax=Hexamita inflata TaxID=28002 RepID=A0ABP1GLJ2_9EUKA
MSTKRGDRASRLPNTKNMWCPLSTQYFNVLEWLDVEKPDHSIVKDGCGCLPPQILKRYDTVNHLNNTTTRLCAELDKQLTALREQRAKLKQSDLESYKTKLSQLSQIQFEKLNHAIGALADLKQLRNQLGIRIYQDEHKAEGNISDAVINGKESRSLDDSGILPFTTNDLLQNVRAHSCSGLLGNSLVVPIFKPVELAQFANRFQIDSEEIPQKDFPTLTLQVDERHRSSNLGQLQKVFLSCLDGKLYTNQKPSVTQEEMVLSAFAEISSFINDEIQFPKRTDAQLKDLQEQFRLASKKTELLIQNDHKQKAKIGQIIQNGCLPMFSERDQSSFDSSYQSQVSLSQTAVKPVEQNESVLIEDEEPVLVQIEANSPGQMNVKELLQTEQQKDSDFTENYCVFHLCTNEDDSDMVQCEYTESCIFAKDGWFHPSCLGFDSLEVQKNGIFDESEFYCPGCWVQHGFNFGEWGETFKIGKKKLQAIRKYIMEMWPQQYGLQYTLKKK